LVSYYDSVSSLILPFLKNRPLVVRRYPDGIETEGFYQKNWENLPSWVDRVTIRSKSAEREVTYVVCNNKKTLLYLANLACVELHPWLSSLESLDKPDYFVFDLDPHDVTFTKVIEVAQALHTLLTELDIPHFCKTTGLVGLHIVVPLGAQYSYAQALEFGKIIALLVNKKLPKITSLERSPEKRKKKVYLDLYQNRKGQTVVAPYSLRASQLATVSMPVAWSEVKAGLKQESFTLKDEVSEKMWEGVNKQVVELRKVLGKLEDPRK